MASWPPMTTVSSGPAQLNLRRLGSWKTVLPEDSYLSVAFSAAPLW